MVYALASAEAIDGWMYRRYRASRRVRADLDVPCPRLEGRLRVATMPGSSWVYYPGRYSPADCWIQGLWKPQKVQLPPAVPDRTDGDERQGGCPEWEAFRAGRI